MPFERRGSLVEHFSEVVSVIDAAGIITYVSPSLTRHLGWTSEEAVGRPIADFVCLERHPDFEDVFAIVSAAPGTHGPFGLNLVHRDGSTRLFQSVVTNRLDDPDVHGLVTVARDETDRMVAEEALRAAEARFRALVKFSSDIVVLTDIAGLVRYVSPSVERVLGIPADGDIQNVFDLIHPDDLPVAVEAFRRLRAEPGSSVGPVEVRLAALDGSWRNLEVLATNLSDDPDVGGIVFNSRDVSERRRAEALVSEQARVLEGIALGLSLDTTIHRVVDMIDRRIPDAMGSVAAFEPDGQLRHAWAPNLPTDLLTALNAAGPGGVLERSVREGAPAIFSDLLEDGRWEFLHEPLRAAGFGSCWCLPMHGPGGGELIGMVVVFHAENRGPTREELALVERSRNLAAIAVERRRFEGKLEHQAVHDVLTGLPNRLLLIDRVDQALARALAGGPELLLLDEPLSALDAGTRADTRRELRRHLDAFRGVTVVVTHDPLDALLLAGPVVVIEGGRVVQAGPLTEVTARPRTRYVAALMGTNLLTGVRDRSDRSLVHVDDTEVVVADEGPDGSTDDVFLQIAPSAISLHPTPPGGSPRNAWPLQVVDLDQLGGRIRVHLAGPVSLVAEITPAAAADLGLAPGAPMWAAVKATEVAVYPR